MALNLDDSSTPAANSVILTAGNTVATWIFNTPGTFISDGDYTFTLPAGEVADVSGNMLQAQYQVTGTGIYFLAGDANRDRRVNVNDFTILAGNFNQSNRSFSQGDFNYDTIVNVNDFTILAGRFGVALAPDSSLQRSTERLGTINSRFGAMQITDNKRKDEYWRTSSRSTQPRSPRSTALRGALFRGG